MTRHRCWSMLIGLLVVLGWVGLAAAQQPKPGGTLRVAYESDITGLDPHVSFGVQAWHVVGSLFNSLVTIDDQLNFVPDLAESWEILDNGKVYVFHLRKGVKFHDGTDFDAAAVRWNYQRIVDPDEKALDAPYYSIVDSVDALDAHTIRFALKHPSMTLLPVMAATATGFLQISPAAYKEWGKEELRLHPVGTGPFKLARWEQNQVFRGKDTQRILTFFNQRKGLFQDVRVRRAVLGYGIDRPAIVKTALLGMAQPLWSFVPPGSRGHVDFGEQFPYDPEKAKALLKEVGYDDKNPLRITLMAHSAEASLPTIAAIMKTQLAKIGVDVTVEILDRPVFLRRITRDRDWELVIANTAAAIDPHAISRALDTRAGSNVINHADTHVDALIDRLRQAAAEEDYLKAGFEFQRYVVENMMSTSVASFAFLQAARSYVKGQEQLHGYKLRFETTWLDKPPG